MYGDPTRDYPQVWSDFTKTYLGIAPPEEEFRYGFALVPEILFRSSTHYSTLTGDLLAEQLNDHILREVLGKDVALRPCYAKEPKVGAFLRENIMELGDLHHWEKLVKQRLGGAFAKGFYLKRSFNIETTTEHLRPAIKSVMPQ